MPKKSKRKRHTEADKYAAHTMYASGTLTIKEISKKLRIPVGTIRTWVHRGGWVRDRKAVSTYVQKKAVQQARQNVSLYYTAIDSSLNLVIARLAKRLDTAGEDELILMKKEESVLKIFLEALRLKIALARSLSYASKGAGFSPDPLYFSPEELTSVKGVYKLPKALSSSEMWGEDALESFLESVPPFIKEATEFVVAIDDPDDVIIDAVDSRITKDLELDDDSMLED